MIKAALIATTKELCASAKEKTLAEEFTKCLAIDQIHIMKNYFIPKSDYQQVVQTLHLALSEGPELVITTGGTGIGPNDFIPQVLDSNSDYMIAGFGEQIRREGALSSPKAALSRCAAYKRGNSLIVALSAGKATREQWAAIRELTLFALGSTRGKCSNRDYKCEARNDFL